jgi:hypothetical protein
MVVHADEPSESGGLDLYAVVEGEERECLKKLMETL